MALIHRAELRPGKMELLHGWAPSQPWFEATATATANASATPNKTETPNVTATPKTTATPTNIASFRIDDPQGEVGLETLLVRVGDAPLLHIPVTYRGAPLEGAEAFFIGTTEHSVLGTRWVYDAVGDPVYLAAIVETVTSGGRHADQFVDIDGELTFRESTALVRGSGRASIVVSPPARADIAVRHELGHTVSSFNGIDVVVYRTPEAQAPASTRASTRASTPADASTPSQVLTGTWAGQPTPQTILLVQMR